MVRFSCSGKLETWSTVPQPGFSLDHHCFSNCTLTPSTLEYFPSEGEECDIPVIEDHTLAFFLEMVTTTPVCPSTGTVPDIY